MLRPYTTYSITVGADNGTLESTEYGFPFSFTTKQSSEFLSLRLSLNGDRSTPVSINITQSRKCG